MHFLSLESGGFDQWSSVRGISDRVSCFWAAMGVGWWVIIMFQHSTYFQFKARHKDKFLLDFTDEETFSITPQESDKRYLDIYTS